MKENKVKRSTVSRGGAPAEHPQSELRDFQKKILSAVMAAGTSDMHERISDPDTKAVFRYLNGFLSHVIPVIRETDGEINKISEQGVMALYAGNVKKALLGAVSMCQKPFGQGGDEAWLSVALCFGYIMSGIVGYDTTLAPITLSEYTGLAGFLQETAPRYGCHILITENCAQEIPDFRTGFHARYLGRIYLTRSDAYERLYDVFDGDSQEMRIHKMKSKTIFERAVERFEASDFRGARAHFIEVLKADRRDLAAREYLYLCDRYIAEEENALVRQKGYLLTF